jgi:predicted nucleic-acid-binding protein
MKALDTNVLVRFLVRDDERQAQAVYKELKLPVASYGESSP